MGDFVMPSLGADMEVGTVLEWRVRPGDEVHRGDIVAVVDTEKSTIEVEVFQDGVVAELLVDPGQEVPVGTPLARIDAVTTAPAGAPPGTAAVVAAAPADVDGRGPARPSLVVPRVPPAAGGHVRASPLARLRAAERGIALDEIAGSGPGGAVVAADVERVSAPSGRVRAAEPAGAEREPAATPEPAAPPARGEPAGEAAPAGAAGTGEPARAAGGGTDRRASLRRAIAALMARSAREVPHYHVATTVDLSQALAWMVAANERRPPNERLLPVALLLKASAVAAREVPELNGFWEDDRFRPSEQVHLGVAVSLRGGGLVAPAIHDADRLRLDDLMVALRDLVGRTRAGTLRSSEMSDSTITVTNLGDQGVDEVHGVIYPPQVALVGFGRIAERPWARDGMLAARPTVRATLAADHRASDGLTGARFLATIDRLLQTPEEL